MKIVYHIPEVKIGGGYRKAILMNGAETVFGCDEQELAKRLTIRLHVLRSDFGRKVPNDHIVNEVHR